MRTRLPKKLEKMLEHFLTAETATRPELKMSAYEQAAKTVGATFSSGEAPDALKNWIDKVACHAYTTADQDVADMKAAGYSEDQILEITIASALGASLARAEAGLVALRGGGA